MADASGPSGGGYDYVQDSTNSPNNPKTGEEWYQPDTDDVKTYDGGTWVDVKISDHDQLSGVSPADHFSPGSGLTFNSGTLALLLAASLGIDGNGDLAVVPDAPITEGSNGVGLSYGDGLTTSGGSLIAALGNGLATDQNGQIEIPNGAIDTAELLADAVTSAIIAADAVTNTQIAADAVDSAQVAADAITGALIASGAVGPSQASLGNALGGDGSGNIAVQEGQISHDNIGGVSSADHHAKPSGGTGLSFDSTNNEYDALLGNALGTDGSGNIAVQEGNIALSNLSGYPVGYSDLNNAEQRFQALSRASHGH